MEKASAAGDASDGDALLLELKSETIYPSMRPFEKPPPQVHPQGFAPASAPSPQESAPNTVTPLLAPPAPAFNFLPDQAVLESVTKMCHAFGESPQTIPEETLRAIVAIAVQHMTECSSNRHQENSKPAAPMHVGVAGLQPQQPTIAGEDSKPAARETRQDYGAQANHDSKPASQIPLPAPAPLVLTDKRWPSLLMFLMNSSDNGDHWTRVMDRIQTHAHEIPLRGKLGGQNAIHAACLRYPPAHVIRALVQACPEAATKQNKCLESPLHLACFSASEEVQQILIRAAPETAHMADRYGDTPLHFAARQGASYALMALLVETAPEAICAMNQRGVTPTWLLPRSYLHAESLQDIFRNINRGGEQDGGDSESSEDEDGDYQNDWDLLVLFLRFSYYEKAEAVRRQAAAAAARAPNPLQYEWMVYAAASTPACPTATLKFLCRMFPHTAMRRDSQGYTPLLHACRAAEMAEPNSWDETEDGFRAPVVAASAGPLQNENQRAPAEAVALSAGGDLDFLQRQVLNNEPSVSHAVAERFIRMGRQPNNDTGDAKESSPMVPLKPGVLDILLEWSPASASVPDRQGRLPLVHALLAGKSWPRIRKLVAACPRALETRDVVSRQFMFSLAALHAPELDTTYNIVRTLPGLVTGQVQRTPKSVVAAVPVPEKSRNAQPDPTPTELHLETIYTIVRTLPELVELRLRRRPRRSAAIAAQSGRQGKKRKATKDP